MPHHGCRQGYPDPKPYPLDAPPKSGPRRRQGVYATRPDVGHSQDPPGVQGSGRIFSASDQIGAALDIDIPDSLLKEINEFEARKVDAEQDMVHGALQIAASRLLGQRTQENAGHKEMIEGFSALRNLREERAKHTPRSFEKRRSERSQSGALQARLYESPQKQPLRRNELDLEHFSRAAAFPTGNPCALILPVPLPRIFVRLDVCRAEGFLPR